jgi:hypothetical protein
MNPELKKSLDKICKETAVKHAVSEKLVNIFIQIQVVKTKVEVIAQFATSRHADIPDACKKLMDDVVNIAIIAGSLAGIDEVEKLMELYQDVERKVMPVFQINYMQGPSSTQN